MMARYEENENGVEVLENFVIIDLGGFRKINSKIKVCSPIFAPLEQILSWYVSNTNLDTAVPIFDSWSWAVTVIMIHKN